ncbi:unnamed protein product [Adineta ricciae]|uniref:Uncharacterized protein n=2 Tax=Adineta ricciae TaxID=249248 RepID=A0A815KF91_ADIRI|nr:unnamed protein product [Adineta ricciae]
MTWISLVCLLALSSSALARSVSYGSYGSVQMPQVSSANLIRDFGSQQVQQPSFTQTGYGQQPQVFPQPSLDERVPQPEIQSVQTGYGQQYAAPSMIRKTVPQFDQSLPKTYPMARPTPTQIQLLEEQKLQLKKIIDDATIPTEADNLCRGQRPETVIPLDNGRRFVVCIDEAKGQEQTCPRGLLFHPESRRCERKLGPLENPCSSQPCLNNGQCVQTDFTSYKCQCAPGFDGEHCELDATVCQTQQPCGQSPDTKCQSFRWGAALKHICILQNGRAYGLTASQATPSPCTGVDGVFPLAFSDKGFIMCNGDLMYIETCPGGTVWDDLNKACVWPDMQGLSFEDQTPQVPSYGQSSYGSVPRSMTPQADVPQYGQIQIKTFTQPKLDQVSTYGQVQTPLVQDLPKQTYGGYQQPQIQIQIPQQDVPKSFGGYQQPQIQIQQDLPKVSYGGYQQPQKPQVFQLPQQKDFLRPQPQQPSSGY